MKEKKRGPEFDYSQKYEETLEWVRRDEHIKKSRQMTEQPELHDAICRVAAAIITLINSQVENPIPEGKWKAYRGKHTARPQSLERGSFTVSVGEIGKLIGLPNMPKAAETTPADMNTPHRFITVIWQRFFNDGEAEFSDNFKQDQIRPANLVTAFPSINEDQVLITKADQDYRWTQFGASTDRQTLIDQLLKRIGN